LNFSVPVELTNNKIRNITFQVLVDMNADGIYEVDITSDIESIDNIITDLQIKSSGSVLGKPSINTSSITIINTNGRYSPNNINNIESEYSGQFRTGTKIRIDAGFIDNNNQARTRNLFTGIITNFKNKISKDKRMILELKDMATYAMWKKNPNHSYVNNLWYESAVFDKTISEAISILVDFCYGINLSRTIHTLNDKLPIVEFPVDGYVWSTLQKLAEAVDGRIFFDGDEFKFYSPLSPDWNQPLESQYIFNADNIQDFTETIDFDNIKNKWTVKSSPKTLQIRQVLCGTPSSNAISSTDEYWTGDGKSALGVDNKTITLKSQEDDLSWINSLNVPLVDTQTYSDLIQLIPSPTQDQINAMNNASLIKIWDKINNIQLTINNIDTKTGTIELLNTINPDNYNLQITYQYYQDQIVHGKYRWYIYDLEKIGVNIEYPVLLATNNVSSVTYSTTTSTNNLYLSDWTIYEGNKRVKFKLTNNYPISGNFDTIYLTKFEVWGNALECTSPLSFEAINGDTIGVYEHSYDITNDYISSIVLGKQIVDYHLYKYQNNLTFLDVNTKGIPQIDLLDRVTVNESNYSGNNFDYIVIGIKHSIKKDGWKTNLQLESLIPPWTYDPTRVNALFYKMGQSYLSLYSTATPSNPNDFQVVEQTFLQTSGEVVTRIYVTFVPPLYNYYSHTLIQISEDNGLTWKDVGTSSDGKFYINNVVVGTTYKVRGLTVSLNNQRSNAIEKTITIVGKDTPPSDITGFNIMQSGKILKVSLVHPGDPDIRNFELRYGSSWVNSSFLKSFIDNTTTLDAVQEGTQTFWIKAVDNSGNYSTNAKKAIITVVGLPLQNVIAEDISVASDWIYTNMYRCPLNPQCVVIDTIETFDSGELFCDIFEGGSTLKIGAEVLLPVIDLGPNVVEENYFYYDAYGIARLKTTKTLNDFTHFFDIFGYSHQYVIPQYKIETFMNINLNYQKNENNYINIQYRTSIDNINWGQWTDLINHQFFGRYLQLKLFPGSLDNQTNVILCEADVKIDIPDLEDNIENVDIPAAKTFVAFRQRFFDIPKSIALFTCDITGKQCTWRSNPAEWTKNGFYIELLDSSNNLIVGKLILAKVRGY
jgi:hypothetical protein